MTIRAIVAPPKLRVVKFEDKAVERFINTDVNRCFTQIFDNFRSLLRAPQFIAPTLLNSWVNFGSGHSAAGYYKDPLSRVHLKGLIKDGTATSGTVLFTLPLGYYPTETLAFGVLGESGGADALARIEIQTDGDVAIISGGNDYLSLNGVSFAAV